MGTDPDPDAATGGDEPAGPRYLDHPDLKAWAEANARHLRPDPGPAPVARGIRRRRRPAG